jgi:hypothetical protein
LIEILAACCLPAKSQDFGFRYLKNFPQRKKINTLQNNLDKLADETLPAGLIHGHSLIYRQ